MSDITMRIWHGSRVVGVITVAEDGSGSWVGAPGGAHNATKPQVEIDPWESMVMDHRPQHFSPVNWGEAEAHECVGGRIDPEDVRAYDPESHTGGVDILALPDRAVFHAMRGVWPSRPTSRDPNG